MSSEQILSLLISERDRLNTAIAALQGPAKRGRPPKNPRTSIAKKPASRKRRAMSATQKKAASERMKKYWANRRKQEKG